MLISFDNYLTLYSLSSLKCMQVSAVLADDEIMLTIKPGQVGECSNTAAKKLEKKNIVTLAAFLPPPP